MGLMDAEGELEQRQPPVPTREPLHDHEHQIIREALAKAARINETWETDAADDTSETRQRTRVNKKKKELYG